MFWLLSLICSLFAAFLATLVQQWSKDYMQIFKQADNPLQIARIRVLLFEGSKSLPVLAEVVHGLIHTSLILFFWGLGDIILQSTQPFFSSSWVRPLSAYASIFTAQLHRFWIPNRPIEPLSRGSSSKSFRAIMAKGSSLRASKNFKRPKAARIGTCAPFSG
jgi:hypothetical protein